MRFILVMAKPRFFRNHSNMLIWCSSNISYYHQCWKQMCWL